MDRVLINAPATISATWYSGGTIVDPGVVSVTVVRADGTSVVSGSATGTGANPRNFNLTSTHTNQLDKLRSTWVSAALGTLVKYHEIVGDFLFTISDGLTTFPGQTAAQVAATRVKVEQELEDACGVAFVPRYDREALSGNREKVLVLRRCFLRSIRAITIDGQLLDPTQLAKVIPDGNVIFYENGFTRGIRNVVVDYEHGFDTPPGGADRAALRLAQRNLVPESFDDRVISASAGEESFTFATRSQLYSGSGGVKFGIPEVDAFVAANDHKVTVG